MVGGGDFTPEYSHVLLFSFHTRIIKSLLTHFPPAFRSEVFLTLNPLISCILFQMLALWNLSSYLWIQTFAGAHGRQHIPPWWEYFSYSFYQIVFFKYPTKIFRIFFNKMYLLIIAQTIFVFFFSINQHQLIKKNHNCRFPCSVWKC